MLETALLLATLASTAFTILLLSLPSRYVKHSPPRTTRIDSGDEPKICVQVLVLGDIGRSPRMQYHAMSIAKHGAKVDIIGYQGIYQTLRPLVRADCALESPLHSGLVGNPLITTIPLPPPPPALRSKSIPFIITGPLKVLWQIYSLVLALGYRTRPSRFLLVQNPPSIPTLIIAYLICFLRNTHLIIDWHNYGWTILAGTRGSSHPFVSISKYYEAFLGRWAPTASFAVTNAMARQLKEAPYNIRSPIFTLHDRPAEIFQPISSADARKFFLSRLSETSPYADSIMKGDTRLIVSSTSWTPDEDFSILLSALKSYSALTTTVDTNLSPILAIITGKGPDKQKYLDEIAQLTKSGQLTNVTILTAWLSHADYATLLACADLGVCLHMSSSGVDLPMKVVDMFGAGLPVAGYCGYESWPELVTEGENGMGFEKPDELVGVLKELFTGGEGQRKLNRLREGAVKEGKRRWDEEWDAVAGRLFGLCD
jgi:beta-1,4-mannosyltransferase